MRGSAEEEAAKFLILIDYVRCSRKSEHRTAVLKRFYGHVAKRIHAMACSYPSIWTFGELTEWVESECRPWYLDGPNGVDWIFRNTIAAEREQGLYVDFVRDITDPAGACHWTAPADPFPCSSEYETPDCLSLSQALCRAGAATAEGLAEIARIWRSFEPKPDTDRKCLRGLIGRTLDRLAQLGHAVDAPTGSFILSHWPFPMWPLTMKEPRAGDGGLDDLREERQRRIEWIEETEAIRDPPPAIARSKVEELSAAYAAWERDSEARAADRAGNESPGPRIRSSADIAKDLELPSYARLKDTLGALSETERAALVALGWYARRWIIDWPSNYERAIELTPTYGDDYQIGLGSSWLAGMNRWEKAPQLFQAGRLHPDP